MPSIPSLTRIVSDKAPDLWKDATEFGKELMNKLEKSGDIITDYKTDGDFDLELKEVRRIIFELSKAWD